jgi:hypothetical protein
VESARPTLALPAASRFVPHAVLALVATLCVGASAAAAQAAPLPAEENEYNAAGFVVRHAWVKFALVAADPFRDDLSREEEDALVAQFFEINATLRETERVAGDPAASAADAGEARAASDDLRAERAGIENRVEAILEGRLTRVLEEAGLTRHYGGDIVWPPVNIEFEDPPSVLIRSPRDEIRKDGERLLDAGLPVERRIGIEADAERDGETSALVVDIGAIAIYPAIVPPSSNYRAAMDTIAHEWLHHYLYFAPLGRRYYQSGELRTLNETVANMGGRELGARLVELYPIDLPPRPASAPPVDARADPIDFTAEMRGLRRDVEALLRDGKIDDAERLMEERRQFLADNGYFIRRLNQAYFAFHGAYADTPSSIDPIGPKLQDLRDRTSSVEEFVETAREFTSARDLDRAIQP